MDAVDGREAQALNPCRGACFACGLGAGNTHTIEWQSSLPNPLPIFEHPTDFYTPLLLPGMYLPLDVRTLSQDKGIAFFTLENAELAQKVAAFLNHEAVHRHLLTGLIPMHMRLVASRCYALLALLIKHGFDLSSWELVWSQSHIIDNFCLAIAPLHEVVANLMNIVTLKDDAQAIEVSEQSLTNYSKVYGESFTQVLSDFNFVIRCLEDRFAPHSIDSNTMITLAEFILMGAIDVTEIRNDVLTPTPVISRHLLPDFLTLFGVPYLEAREQPPILPLINTSRYSIYNITERLQEVKSGIQKAKFRRSKKPLTTAVEQILYIANVIPNFQEWLQRIEVFSWLKRRIFDGISEIQKMVERQGFDLPLIEAWQADISPFIIISILDKLTDDVRLFNYARQGEHERVIAAMAERILSDNVIAFYLPSGKALAIWYAPACDEVSHMPITATVATMVENDDAAYYLAARLHTLTVFESLRLQTFVYRKGITCPLRYQYDRDSGGCCGRAGLLWSIYEAGLKAMAIKELNWQPTKWVEPECSKPDNR